MSRIVRGLAALLVGLALSVVVTGSIEAEKFVCENEPNPGQYWYRAGTQDCDLACYSICTAGGSEPYCGNCARCHCGTE
jgi:hypothetical protein